MDAKRNKAIVVNKDRLKALVDEHIDWVSANTEAASHRFLREMKTLADEIERKASRTSYDKRTLPVPHAVSLSSLSRDIRYLQTNTQVQDQLTTQPVLSLSPDCPYSIIHPTQFNGSPTEPSLYPAIGEPFAGQGYYGLTRPELGRIELSCSITSDIHGRPLEGLEANHISGHLTATAGFVDATPRTVMITVTPLISGFMFHGTFEDEGIIKPLSGYAANLKLSATAENSGDRQETEIPVVGAATGLEGMESFDNRTYRLSVNVDIDTNDVVAISLTLGAIVFRQSGNAVAIVDMEGLTMSPGIFSNHSYGGLRLPYIIVSDPDCPPPVVSWPWANSRIQ